MTPLILQALASGIVTGCVYSLIALSLVIVYKSTDVINFAGGEIVMAGAYLGMLALLWLGLPYVLIFVFGAVVTFAMGAVFDRVVLHKVLGRAVPGQSILVAMVIATVGLSYVLKGAVRVVPFTEEVRQLPPFIAGDPIFLGPVVLQPQDIAIVVIAVIVMVALWLFFGLTLTGKALRATSQNPRAAALVGIPVRGMRMTVWGLASALAAIAGILIAPKLPMTPDMGIIVILAFAAAIIGGFASLPGCIIGGILLGVIQNFVGLFVSSRAISVAPFVVIMLILVLRPQGLLGGRVVAKKV
ncbi:MAG: branched-chain amino acid ABC transporter permease [Rhodospirillaceae bacterium]|nr:branched-chain amino acid ABC transporter permease [Rhodospirillaceae bacterium]